MNKPEFDDISYWYKKSQHLEALLEDCHKILNDDRSIVTVCFELVAYKNMIDGGTDYELNTSDSA